MATGITHSSSVSVLLYFLSFNIYILLSFTLFCPFRLLISICRWLGEKYDGVRFYWHHVRGILYLKQNKRNKRDKTNQTNNKTKKTKKSEKSEKTKKTKNTKKSIK